MKNKLQQYLDEVDTMADGAGYGIEPFIKRPVAIFRMIGFPTIMSCEGHSDREGSLPWIWIDSFPNYPNKIMREEWEKVVADPIQFQKMVDRNYSHQQRLQNLLKRAGYSDNFLIEDTKDHFYNSFKFWSVGSTLGEARQAMIDFTEWLLETNLHSSMNFF